MNKTIITQKELQLQIIHHIQESLDAIKEAVESDHLYTYEGYVGMLVNNILSDLEPDVITVEIMERNQDAMLQDELAGEVGLFNIIK